MKTELRSGDAAADGPGPLKADMRLGTGFARKYLKRCKAERRHRGARAVPRVPRRRIPKPSCRPVAQGKFPQLPQCTSVVRWGV